MTDVISSRTPEGEPFRCSLCGLNDQIEPSRPPGDATCPGCGNLIWPSGKEMERRRSRTLVDNAESFLRSGPRVSQFGLVATLRRQVVRAWNARPRLERRETVASKSGVYDHWLDG